MKIHLWEMKHFAALIFDYFCIISYNFTTKFANNGNVNLVQPCYSNENYGNLKFGI